MNEIEVEILKKVLEDDEVAFMKIVECFQRPVYNLCFRMLGNKEAAEDAAQETFWKAFQSIRKYNPERSFSTWLLSISAHHCIDQYRKRKFLGVECDDYLAEIVPDLLPRPESIFLQKEQQKQVQDILNGLPDLDRASIILRYWHECSEEEIGLILNISKNAVKSRLHRARKKLAIVWQNRNQYSTQVERRNYLPLGI
ncbi:MAG TPA: sigma-70 family RNA polymerase sigma factor [Anaerolineaceae bacterium]|nr:sigma-70 family RNA polymerase sigma factor [Anaerolineaceae bacterium]